MTEKTLANIIIRNPTLADAKGVTDLVVFLDIQDTGESDITEEVILDEWGRSRFDLSKDAWVAAALTDHGEQIIGYEEAYNRDAHAYYMADGYVHTHYRGLGIGTALLQHVEERIHEQIHLTPPDRDVYVPRRCEREGSGRLPVVGRHGVCSTALFLAYAHRDGSAARSGAIAARIYLAKLHSRTG